MFRFVKPWTLFAGLYGISVAVLAIGTGQLLMALGLAIISAVFKTAWARVALRVTQKVVKLKFPILFAGMVAVTSLLLWVETGQILAGVTGGLIAAALQSAYSFAHHWWVDHPDESKVTADIEAVPASAE